MAFYPYILLKEGGDYYFIAENRHLLPYFKKRVDNQN